MEEPLSPEPPSPEEQQTEAAQVTMDDLLGEQLPPAPELEDSSLRAVLEAIVYVTEEPLTLAQISAALQRPAAQVKAALDQLVAEYEKPEHGLTVREVAGGFKMATKPEHHEAVRDFVKSLKPPLKLSLPALETLAVIAYKQPVTSPEIMEIRGVQGAGVLKTLLDRKLIAVAGRKNVIGKPILYKTTREFLIQFGLKDLSELPSLKEFEEIRRMAFTDSEPAQPEAQSEQLAAPAEEVQQPDAADAPAGAQPPEEASAPGPIETAARTDEPVEAPPEAPAASEEDAAGQQAESIIEEQVGSLPEAASADPGPTPEPAADPADEPKGEEIERES